MSIIMGIMAVFMVVGIISGHRHMKGGMMGADDKAGRVEQGRDPAGGGQDNMHICEDCPPVLGTKDGVDASEEGLVRTKDGDETGK